MLPPKPLVTSVKTVRLPRMKSAGAAVRLGMLCTPAAVIAIELMSAVQGLDCGEKQRPGRGVAAAYACVRSRVSPLEKDRFLAPDIAQVEELVRTGEVVRAVLEAAGVRDILTKCLRTNNPHNVVKATIQGLMDLRSAKDCARARGKQVG